ncbi:MAG TPA: uroporphyrinogen-III C-methyltransferase [Desulfobacteria bacterium]|nr:uroporphyrinogen-III C-methyltransferase [Desulfobacteria bacterium]
MGRGIVFLAGAGPGDPKLVTVKCLECIQKADVIVYDRLSSKRLLSYAKPDCELIFAGKYPDNHVLRQGQINQLLAEKALEGKIVTRLKGGDPFVFGRGGEEAEYLFDQGVEFEIIPGISSSIAVPAYAGIPVTHRDFTTSFAVITGHLKYDKAETSIRWDKITEAHGTLIFLMGMEKLAMIVQKLQENGKDPATPIALVRWGTTADQQTITGTLADIVDKAIAGKFGSPAVVVVGAVVSLREKLKWFENKPLFGKRIVVTRARGQASVLSEKIENLGGDAWEFPVIEFVPPTDYAPLDNAINALQSFTWLIFTSANAVKFFFQRLSELGKDFRELAGLKICTAGPATKKAVESYHLRVDLVPDDYKAEGVIDALKTELSGADRVLLPRAEVAREVLPETIAAQGIPIEVVPVYRTVQANSEKGPLIEMLTQKMADVVTFTSSSTVKNFVELVGRDQVAEQLKGVTVASIGPITSATIREYGLDVDVEAEKYTIDGLIQELIKKL